MNEHPIGEATRDRAEAMVDSQLRGQGIRDERVLRAMARVPRHRFVPEQAEEAAYDNRALPTAEGQTISQPFMVARMTEALDPRPGLRVLEIGTGSGYQTAVLLELGLQVVSIERFPTLAVHARQRLSRLYPQADVAIHVGDGTLGYGDAAPYDRILVAAGAPDVPEPLWDQLSRRDGRIVIPLGDREQQTLTIVLRRGDRRRDLRDVSCRFVPLVGEQGWPPT
jgi:protein-L-isoaspartate(D-aspartate) O-methyltransferase